MASFLGHRLNGAVCVFLGYRLNGAKAALALRSMQLLNESLASDKAKVTILQNNLRKISSSMTSIHTLNFVSPISAFLTNEFLENTHTEKVFEDGRLKNRSPLAFPLLLFPKFVQIGYMLGLKRLSFEGHRTTNFYDFTNNYINSILTASYTTPAELQSMIRSKDDEMPDLGMSQQKAAVAFM